MAKVLLGCPAYEDKMGTGPAKRFWREETRKHLISHNPRFGPTDLVCTQIWCDALNNRDTVNYMAMLHADVTPDPYWIDTLIDQMELHGADFISALSPIKDRSSLHSTALELLGWNKLAYRLSVKQAAHHDFPTTFGAEEAFDALERLPEPLRVTGLPRGGRLFCNTGCMVVRVDRPWAEKVWFHTETTMERGPDGVLYPFVKTEDFGFTGDISKHGGKVMATKAVKISHRGIMDFESDQEWGPDRDEGVLKFLADMKQ